ncbi:MULTISPECIES: sugar ABC transporter ATP-binding protein [unclassified Rhodococcus (in: high G+C Gram-positive bacteria)]|uniref:sugar ABC transporter ATP-binding protein n=1 Tax=unclassified Rhodococcus (in: high G+C Gram-positive bacteria) TaxID=192944 RepID=UPI0006F7FE92|nr:MULTISPECIES: sugar ABC transporter ATP-binding protein [unclassified Rhodococcus (in: high G+C Gram-positive bacteria)]KQU28442.1 hypothetical protein ASG69_10555 [Rhodococcus sp. Leaf225]KQU47679.1 hypothetical protein ASH03_21505 [Rhodococcus sp. Leaf258]
MTTPAVQVTEVSKFFGATRALSNVSLAVERGTSLALLGRNGAGKSTLVSVIAGLSSPDSGSIRFGDGRHGSERGVGCVYQKSTLIPGLTAAENISLHNYPRTRAGSIDWRQVRRNGTSRLNEWNCGHVSNKLVEDLEPVERKIVEISRVLSLEPDVLLLDEPTAGLDYAGSQRLFKHIHEARDRGVSIIYVSHHLEEIFDVCQTTTVLRDGEVVLDCSLDGLNVTHLVDAMVGDDRSAQRVQQPPAVSAKEPLLRVTGLTGSRFDEVSFDVRPGECVGITGLDGSGHVQIAEALCGLSRPESGTVSLSGTVLKATDVRGCIAAGIGFVPEDRNTGGFVPALSIAENATLPVMRQITNVLRVIDRKKRESIYQGLADDWAIKAWGPAQPVGELSGGNQQKVVLARAVSSDPDVLILMNPTAGVDVAAKQSIYESVQHLAARGKSIVIVSSDDEDFSICHRAIVLFQGRVHRELIAPFSDTELSTSIQGN